MFKNHKIEIKLAKTPKNATEESTPVFPTPEEIAAHARKLIGYSVIAVGLTVATTIVVQALSDIAVNSIDNHQKKDKN